ncbi:MAG: acyl-CoA thioesterase [Chlorobiaceae bacterium]|nr:acyl-CoA thioesterase [Chlorobiaceae bacterium]
MDAASGQFRISSGKKPAFFIVIIRFLVCNKSVRKTGKTANADAMIGRFEITLRVEPEDIDMLGHVSNIVYLRWIQDVAIAHWDTLAPQGEQEKLVWVVRRHEIDYKRPAMPGDTVIVRTWIGEAVRMAFDRHTEILRASDGRLLAQARTVWCPIDRKTGKPTDVSPEIRALFSVSE